MPLSLSRRCGYHFNGKFQDVLRIRFIRTFGLISKHFRFIKFNGFLITIQAKQSNRTKRTELEVWCWGKRVCKQIDDVVIFIRIFWMSPFTCQVGFGWLVSSFILFTALALERILISIMLIRGSYERHFSYDKTFCLRVLIFSDKM